MSYQERKGEVASACLLQENAASSVAIALYLSCVRRLLKKTGGYECQEGDSTFMLAFERPLEAVQFCLLVSLSLPMAVVRPVHSACAQCSPFHTATRMSHQADVVDVLCMRLYGHRRPSCGIDRSDAGRNAGSRCKRS